MNDEKLQAELKNLRRLVDLLKGTLLDTERVLFDTIVAAAVKHFGMVKKDHAFACNEILTNLAALKKARPKRLATLANKTPACRIDITQEEYEFLLAISRNPGKPLDQKVAHGKNGRYLFIELEELGLIEGLGNEGWKLTCKGELQIEVRI